MKKLMRVRVFGYDFDGKKSSMSHVQYVESLEHIKGKYWKVQQA